MAMAIKCSGCGRIFNGRDEHGAEVAYEMHDCAAKHEARSMSMDELLAKIKSQGKVR
jgi:hypothetical protein